MWADKDFNVFLFPLLVLLSSFAFVTTFSVFSFVQALQQLQTAHGGKRP